MDIKDRLYSKGILNASTGCLEFSGAISSGYGILKVAGKVVKVHRLAYELSHGVIDDGLCIRHKCDNPKCFLVEHLEVGTQKDNVRDMLERGRFHRKLSEEDTTIIINSTKSVKELSVIYGVTRRRINQLRG